MSTARWPAARRPCHGRRGNAGEAARDLVRALARRRPSCRISISTKVMTANQQEPQKKTGTHCPHEHGGRQHHQKRKYGEHVMVARPLQRK